MVVQQLFQWRLEVKGPEEPPERLAKQARAESKRSPNSLSSTAINAPLVSFHCPGPMRLNSFFAITQYRHRECNRESE